MRAQQISRCVNNQDHHFQDTNPGDLKWSKENIYVLVDWSNIEEVIGNIELEN